MRYSFAMFRFTTEPLELYLHCTVQLCAPDDPESCKPVSPIFTANSWRGESQQLIELLQSPN